MVPIPNKDLLSWTFDDSKYDPNKPIYVDAADPTRSISAAQAKLLIRKLAVGFHAVGVRHGDCVCVHAFNDIYYPILFLGIIAAGAVFVGSNPAYTSSELTHHFGTSQGRFILTDPTYLDPILQASQNCKIPRTNVFIFDPRGGDDKRDMAPRSRDWTWLLDHGERDWHRFDDEAVSRTTTAARLFSSGTTGLPKAASISHYNLVAQHTLVFDFNPVPYKASFLAYLPLFHAAMTPFALVAPLRAGQVTYVLKRFEIEALLRSIHRYQITDIVFVPPVVVAILKSSLAQRFPLKSLKNAMSGAGPLDRQNQSALQQLLAPDAALNQVWGMTETTCVASKFYYPEQDDTGSVGYMMPNIDVKVVDDDGKDVTGAEKPGEMCIRGPTVISEYFQNARATAESFDSQGYFKTGDIMYRSSASKKWYVVDRKKELIKVRGFQVSPAEIEGVLLTHPGVADAAVIGIKDDNDATVGLPRAYVVKRDGGTAELSKKELILFCGERLAKYKALTGGICFVNVIPRNAAGKALKRILRETTQRGGRPRDQRL